MTGSNQHSERFDLDYEREHLDWLKTLKASDMDGISAQNLVLRYARLFEQVETLTGRNQFLSTEQVRADVCEASFRELSVNFESKVDELRSVEEQLEAAREVGGWQSAERYADDAAYWKSDREVWIRAHNELKVQYQAAQQTLAYGIALALIEWKEGDVADAVTDELWTELTQDGLIEHGRDFTGEGTVHVTDSGKAWLIGALRASFPASSPKEDA